MKTENPNISVFDAVPPHLLVLIAVVTIQFGAGLAIFLFPVLGPHGTVAIRIIISALLLGVLSRGKVKSWLGIFLSHYKLLLAFGFCLVAMNLFFYMAIARIPLGAAVPIEFIGPLGVAAFKSRRWIHLFWVSLAALGIFLLSPFSGLDLDPVGIGFALLSGAGWASFMLMAKPVGKHIPGNDGLAIGMCIAAVILIPIAIPVVPNLFSDPIFFLAAIGVALLSTTLPLVLEFEALKRISSRTYGILVSVEPAFAAIVGAVLLDERIGWQGIIAVTCVVIAAAGMTLTDNKETKQ